MAQTFEILMLGGRNNIRRIFVKLRIHEAREAADILQKNRQACIFDVTLTVTLIKTFSRRNMVNNDNRLNKHFK